MKTPRTSARHRQSVATAALNQLLDAITEEDRRTRATIPPAGEAQLGRLVAEVDEAEKRFRKALDKLEKFTGRNRR